MIQTLAPGHANALFSLVDVVRAEDYSVIHHLFSFKVISWSMFPTILKDDVVEIGSADQIRIGDVVVFRQMGALICHRVTGLGTAGDLYTNGDQAEGLGTPVPPSDVVGKVRTITRRGKRVPLYSLLEPTAANFVRMKTDLFLTEIQENLLSLASRSVEFLKRFAWVRDSMAFALSKLVRFSVGIRAPIRLIHAYRFMPLHRLHNGCVEVFPAECRTADDLIFIAHVGRHLLATFDPVSGEMHARRIAAGLGLEEHLRDLNRTIQLPRGSRCS